MRTSNTVWFNNLQFLCAMRRKLGLTVTFHGPDRFGHTRVATRTGGGTHARHTAIVAAFLLIKNVRTIFVLRIWCFKELF